MTSAATIPGFYGSIFDEQEEVWGNPGDEINVNPFVEVDSGEVLYAISTDVIGDGIPRECHTFDVIQGGQSETFDLEHTLPPNTGDYDFHIRGFVADNVNQAEALQNIGDGCYGDSDLMYDEDDVVHVIPASSGSSSSSGTLTGKDALIAQLQAQVDDLLAQIAELTKLLQNPPAPSVPAFCSSMPTYNGANRVAVQSWLMTNGFAGPFNSVGIWNVSQLYGDNIVWGSKSVEAYSQAMLACN